ncbi:hypothetical protein [Nocardia arthritidis]|uniref:Uncharacterized protein n=1 Tax=Nocardia arthritidis TaxID=228602 RepID=A0A6G9YBU4_9NOCA|nr:hypothetical protein [Nocardia arthritidis]QIS10638.1 hypothetical protein F5544_13750 [Nocardia arthritidis]
MVFDELRERHGRDAVVMRPIGGGVSAELPAPADPLQGLVIADQVMREARRRSVEYVRRARAEGRSWREIAQNSGLTSAEDSESAAFERFATTPQNFGDLYLSWRCTSCDALVADYGPFSANPGDNEQGHKDSCVRHQAEIRAFEEGQERADTESWQADEMRVAADPEADQRNWRCEQ